MVKKFLTLLLICICCLSVFSQKTTKDFLTIENVKKSDGSGYHVTFSNTGDIPISVWLKFSPLKKEEVIGDAPYTYVIPPKAENYKTVFMKFINNKAPTSRFRYWSRFGDIVNQEHTFNNYQLPYAPGKSYKVSQDENGTISHNGNFAVDFIMEIGTPIHAARSGIVIKAKEDSNKGCGTEKCKDLGNEVHILHDDGTIGVYLHFKHKGVTVNWGDKVKAGKLIGYSGNTGWSTGPHLHFHVWKRDFSSYEQIPFTFLVDKKGTTRKLVYGDELEAVHP